MDVYSVTLPWLWAQDFEPATHEQDQLQKDKNIYAVLRRGANHHRSVK